MPDKVEICNMALGLLGHDSITDLLEATKAARLCRQFFDSSRDSVLAMHPWKCALARAELAALTTPPAFGWDYAYALPSDPWCLRVLEMSDPDEQWDIEGRTLLTNSDSCRIRYIKRVANPGDLSAPVVAVLIQELASRICYSLTANPQLKQSLQAELIQVILPDARGLNAQEEQITDAESSSWLDARL